MKQYIYNLLVMISQLICCVLYFQNPDKSISQLCGEQQIKGFKEPKYWQCVLFWYHPCFIFILRVIIDEFFYLVFREEDHCEDAFVNSQEKNTKDIIKFSLD